MQYFCRVPCFVQLKQYIFLFALSQFLLFLRESWQNKSRNSSFSPFYSAFYPLLFLPSEGMKSVVSNPYFRRKSVFFIPRFYRKSVVFNYWFIGKVCLGMFERGKIYNGRFQINASETCHFLSFYANLSLSELSTTLTLEKAIRALAHIGVIWKSMPKIWRAPAASGMQMML